MASNGGEILSNTVKVAGEALVAPGSSLILDGDIQGGGAHFLGGLVAKWAFGPIGLFLVAANSYSNSVSQKGLLGHLPKGKSGSGDGDG